MKVFVDSSALVALIVRNDGHHTDAVEVLQRLTKEAAEVVLSNFVVAEAYNLISSRTNAAKAREWLLNNTWPVERATPHDEEEARRIIQQYDDKDFSYTDAISFAMIERLDFDLAFTYDHHFRQYGVKTQAMPR